MDLTESQKEMIADSFLPDYLKKQLNMGGEQAQKSSKKKAKSKKKKKKK